ncbi:MAG: histidine kinase [Clostridiales bacterium]|jgi:sensor histidine kinase YesM|nr:histidine kinase [Clostridiales bacterium]
MTPWLGALRRGVRGYRFKSQFAQSFRLIFVGLALPLMAVILAVYLFSQDILGKEMRTANLRALETIENVSDIVFGQAHAAVMGISIDEGVLSEIRAGEPRTYKDYEQVRSVASTLDLSGRNMIADSLYLYCGRADYLIANSGYASRMPYAPDSGLLDIYPQMRFNENVWAHRSMRRSFNEPPAEAITLFRRIGTEGAPGLVAYNIDEGMLARMFGGGQRFAAQAGAPPGERDFADRSIIILGGDGAVLFDSAGQRTGMGADELFGGRAAEIRAGGRGALTLEAESGDAYIAAYSRLSVGGIVCVQMVPYRSYAGSLYALQAFVALSLVVGLLLSAAIAAILGARLSRPIQEIADFIDKSSAAARAPQSPAIREDVAALPGAGGGAKRGLGALGTGAGAGGLAASGAAGGGAPQHGAMADAPADSELNYILMSLISVFDDNQMLEKERLERFAALRQAQAQALQAQIAPHFLHNTLQAVGWLILNETRNEESPALKALVRLSDIARDTMESSASLTTLGAELSNAGRYMELQKLRYLDSIEFGVLVPEGLRGASVPRACLQPLVENSIKFINRQQKVSHITVFAEQIGQDLAIGVRDDGMGMDGGELSAYNLSFLDGNRPFIRHIGLGNLNQRIRLLFGDGYGLSLSAAEGGGLVVLMRVPAAWPHANM